MQTDVEVTVEDSSEFLNLQAAESTLLKSQQKDEEEKKLAAQQTVAAGMPNFIQEKVKEKQ